MARVQGIVERKDAMKASGRLMLPLLRQESESAERGPREPNRASKQLLEMVILGGFRSQASAKWPQDIKTVP